MNVLTRVISPKQALLDDQRVAASIVSEILIELEKMAKPGVDLAMLDELAERMTRERGGVPCNKGYHPEWAATPYPATVCTSVNEEVCHGIPNGQLKEGDIVTFDIGVKYRRGCGDAALTVAIGQIDNRKERLMRYAKRALYEGIKVVKAGVPISTISLAVETFCLKHGYNVFGEFGGHHIGTEMHMEPHIPHKMLPEKHRTEDLPLEEGAVICIEPLLTPGRDAIGVAPDGWTMFAVDGQPVAMFEHMVLVKKDGYEILTTHISE